MNAVERDEAKDIHFKEYLSLKNYHIVYVAKDGNCMFSSLSKAIFGNGVNRQMEIRRQIHDHIQKNKFRFLHYIEYDENPGMTEGEVKQAKLNTIKMIKENTIWGGFSSLKAASEVYKRLIVVEQPLIDPQHFKPDAEEGDAIFLSYHNNNHFNLLHKVQDCCCEDVVVHHSIHHKQQLIDNHFREYLCFRNYLVIQVEEANSPYNVISMVLKCDNGERQMDVRSDIQMFIMNHKLDLRDQLRDHVMSLDETLSSEEDLETAVTDYIGQITSDGTPGDEFIAKMASKCFGRTFLLEKPMESPTCYPKEGDITESTVFLSLHESAHFNLLQKLPPGSTVGNFWKSDAKVKPKQDLNKADHTNDDSKMGDFGVNL